MIQNIRRLSARAWVCVALALVLALGVIACGDATCVINHDPSRGAQKCVDP